ncbi:hypothetical protein L4174_009675 [Photobacterium sp. CCB-ST2H9]|uniref:hypothetical protein n=1 Tax=Photobacterium sp. CCB-ST2H9 TaxID=2912855 RepID=UPI002005E93B|nr:hypothetical protein [Photobacterium sp. CCB-ST2H9]UTM56117.1 hypothetical protein L4174_009675 [Photobacterium sp. CCB-ST2H9]
MRSTARTWLIEEKIGLISKQELIDLADRYIADHDDFPDWMIDISTGSSLEFQDQLDLIIYPINMNDCKIIAQRMLDFLASDEISLKELGKACEQMYLSLEWGSDPFSHFIWISDEINLNEQGYKSTANIDQAVKEALCKIRAL